MHSVDFKFIFEGIIFRFLIIFFFHSVFLSASADRQLLWLTAGPILGSLLGHKLPFTESRSGLSFLITENLGNGLSTQRLLISRVKLKAIPKVLANTIHFAVIDSERPRLSIEHLYSWCSEFQSLDLLLG